MDGVGAKIRMERRRLGLSLEQLAHKVGTSPITLQRIETGKSSPSVALLVEIAGHLNKPIVSFIDEPRRPYFFIKRDDQQSISSSGLDVKIVGPRNMLAPNMTVSFGQLKKGERVDAHTNPGIEYAYNLEGKCLFRIGEESFVQEAGDSISFDGGLEHSIEALEKLVFFGIYLKK
jgi:transcriptional regulator with XRE-family HTH domain